VSSERTPEKALVVVTEWRSLEEEVSAKVAGGEEKIQPRSSKKDLGSGLLARRQVLAGRWRGGRSEL